MAGIVSGQRFVRNETQMYANVEPKLANYLTLYRVSTDDLDAINAWLDERARARPLADVLASADASYQRLASAVDGLTEEDVTTPGRFPWLEDAATLAEADLFTHLHEEHGQDLYAWVRA